jgi:hypothetical protein
MEVVDAEYLPTSYITHEVISLSLLLPYSREYH